MPVATATKPRTPRIPRSGDHAAHEWLAGLLAALGSAHAGSKWQCPVHGREGAHSVALSIGTRDDGTGAWVYCHSGCDLRDVLRALGLTSGHLRMPPPVEPEDHVKAMRLKVGFPHPKAATGSTGGDSPAQLGYRFEAYHNYGPNFRKERLRRASTGEKLMRWEARNPRGEWVPGLLGTRECELPMYCEADIRKGMAMDEVVLLVESESSVDALKGWYATTWAGGASSPPLATIIGLLGEYERLVVIADADFAGRGCASVLRKALPLAYVVQSDVEHEDAKDLFRRLGPAGFAQAIEEVLS